MLERIAENVEGAGRNFDKDYFWYVLLGCLLTTQQRSTTGMPVPRFLEEQPFPLSFEICQKSGNLDQLVLETLTTYRGIRRTSTVARQAMQNCEWLENGGWANVHQLYDGLRAQRQREPREDDKGFERHAARCADQWFAGIGPKQSRNLLQWLGLTRYEIPLDSRVCEWVNSKLSFQVTIEKLGDLKYYEQALDKIQALCAEVEVLPCIFDACAFNDENRSLKPPGMGVTDSATAQIGTTAPGYRNKHGQITIRDTGVAGTDHFQRVYQLACSSCGHTYGANGSDIHERKCPKCQGGRPGLQI